MSVVGIDFGYQSCYIAVARLGGIETVPNEYSNRLTPTFVSLGDKHRSMGDAAKSQLMSHSKNTIHGWKKMIGRKFNDPVVQHDLPYLQYQVVQQPDGSPGIQVQYLGEQEVFTPLQMSAMMLTKLKEIAEINLQTKVVDCVISVPQFWTDGERRAMLDSCKIAGLNCLRLMNDTTAAALAYGIYKQDLPAPEEKSRNVVFVDMGHSSFQVSVCAFNKGKLRVLATASEPSLGGANFDRFLADHFAEEFKHKFKVDAKAKPRAYQRLLLECEKLKKQMSVNSTDLPLSIECFMEDKDVSARLNRESFEKMVDGILSKMVAPLKYVVQEAKLKMDNIDSVEIIGGSTRVPIVKDKIKSVLGKELSTTLNQDEAVARGCALQCAILSPTFRVREFSVVDVVPYPINLTWKDDLEEEGVMEVFSRNHQAPFSKMLTYYRKEAFTIEARYANAADIANRDPFIGSFTIKNVVPNQDGESSKVKVKVRYNIHGIFTVASASMVSRIQPQEEGGQAQEAEAEQPMEVDQPATAAADQPQPPPSNPQQQQQQEEEEPNAAEAEPPSAEQQPPSEVSNDAGGDVPEPQPAEDGQQQQQDEKHDQEKNNKSAENGGTKKEASKKPKKLVKTIDLPVDELSRHLAPIDMDNAHEKECKMIVQDKLEKEKADAKNSVEEYVYDMRSKVYDVYESFISPEDRENFVKLLDDTENWLYDEGEDQSKKVYIDKLAELKKLGQPTVDRHRESEERPRAFENFGHALQLIHKALDSFAKKDEKYAHLTEEEMKKVEKCLREKESWFESKQNAQNQLAAHHNPIVLAQQIKSEMDSLNFTCNPILNKPKPKVEPPKEEKKEQEQQPPADDSGADNSQQANQESAENQPENNKTEEDDDMELD